MFWHERRSISNRLLTHSLETISISHPPSLKKIVDPPLKLPFHTNKPPSPLCWSDSQRYFLERNLRELSAPLVVLSLPVRCFLPGKILIPIMIKITVLGFANKHLRHLQFHFLSTGAYVQDCLKSSSNSIG